MAGYCKSVIVGSITIAFVFGAQVVPVTTDIGLIEWVQNTKPLKAVIEEGLGMPLSQLQAPQLFAQ